MREILFRGNRVDGRGWIYGYLTYDNWGRMCILEYDEKEGRPDKMTTSPVIPETVGQFTGLVDKNGTKIFEGDIVLGASGITRGIVEFGIGRFGILWDIDSELLKSESNDCLRGIHDGFSTKVEIIGNIHE